MCSLVNFAPQTASVCPVFLGQVRHGLDRKRDRDKGRGEKLDAQAEGGDDDNKEDAEFDKC